MVIGKGQPWGAELASVAGVETAASDADLARRVVECSASSRSDTANVASGPMLRVEAGDLLQTVGGNVAEGGQHQQLPMDLGMVCVDDGAEVPFVSSVIIRGRFWSGECAAIMNGAWLSDWYLGPRAHPNDGLLDITVGSLSLADRVQARKRALSGMHLPHPGLRVRRVQRWEHEFATPRRAWVDGKFVGQCRSVSVRLEPDAFVLAV